MSSHSVILAKMFYDAGFSVVILGSAFQWEFAGSMPEGYRPGIPAVDADYLKILTGKILTYLSSKYKYNFPHMQILRRPHPCRLSFRNGMRPAYMPCAVPTRGLWQSSPVRR